jgi:hypothetical protein
MKRLGPAARRNLCPEAPSGEDYCLLQVEAELLGREEIRRMLKEHIGSCAACNRGFGLDTCPEGARLEQLDWLACGRRESVA